jgi:hypothetical protein
VGSPSCGQSEPIIDIMYAVMETVHVGFEELQVKFFCKSTILRNVLIDIPEQFSTRRMCDVKATEVLNGTASKEEFM